MKIIHCIDSLSVGGAEILLRNTIRSLPQFRHIVVYLRQPDTLKNEMPEQTEFYCLDFKGWGDFFRAVRDLKKIIHIHEPALIHSHLFYGTLIARRAAGTKTPLVCSLHSIFSIDAFEKNKLSVWAERFTLKNRHTLVSVSQYVLTDYLKTVGHKGRREVLYNFLPLQSFSYRNNEAIRESLKILAVGGLKEAKNYAYILKVFDLLKDLPIELDIYGEGSLRTMIQDNIDRNQLKVRLMGQVNDISERLPGYDLFIQASLHEGFGLSVIEAMAQSIPVFLSDIPVFHEITGEKAHFFPLDSPVTTAALLQDLLRNIGLRQKFVHEGYQYVLKEYSQERYIQNLLRIYSEASQQDLSEKWHPSSAVKLPVHPTIK
jgi:glycosyltransferase involved in cell wall biosynthesis